jgi:hypothetical protein
MQVFISTIQEILSDALQAPPHFKSSKDHHAFTLLKDKPDACARNFFSIPVLIVACKKG